jgi:hypothetical protein
MECSVCLGNFDIIDACSKCEVRTCIKCMKHLLLTSLQHPCCHGCELPITRVDLVLKINKSFVFGPLKQHIEDLLWDAEQPRLITLQQIYTGMLGTMDEVKDLIIQLRTLPSYMTKTELMIPLRTAAQDPTLQCLTSKIQEITKLLRPSTGERKLKDALIRQIRHKLANISSKVKIDVEEDRHFKKCSGDNCNGYIIDGICGMCTTKMCLKCEKIFEVDHECDENDVASVELIKKETKQCPKCKTNIFKIEGCYQMWCTQCNVAFDWKTGKQLLSRNIHNPHYFEYLRQLHDDDDIVRQLHDDIVEHDNNAALNCRIEDEISEMLGNQEIIKKLRGNDHCSEFYRFIGETYDVDCTEREDETITDKQRMDYLIGKMNKEKFKGLLSKVNKANEYMTERANIIRMFVIAGLEIIYGNHKKKDKVEKINDLIYYVNPLLMNLGNLYGYSYTFIKCQGDIFSWVPCEK